MATGKGRVLGNVSGSIENGSKHWGFMRNGKQHIACRRAELHFNPTNAQKTQMVRFRNDQQFVSAVLLGFKWQEHFGDDTSAAFPADVTGEELRRASACLEKVRANKWTKEQWLYHFKEQTKDENGSVENPTFRGWIIHNIIPTLREAMDNTGNTAFADLVNAYSDFYEETPEGYDQMKATATVNWFVAPEP